MAAVGGKAQVRSNCNSIEHLSRGVWSLESIKILPPATSGFALPAWLDSPKCVTPDS